MSGLGGGKFGPNNSVTREQAATMLYNYAKRTGNDTSYSASVYNSFPDTSAVSSYAVEPLKWATSQGIINGSDGKLNPQGTATRAQIAAILHNAEKVLVKTEPAAHSRAHCHTSAYGYPCSHSDSFSHCHAPAHCAAYANSFHPCLEYRVLDAFGKSLSPPHLPDDRQLQKLDSRNHCRSHCLWPQRLQSVQAIRESPADNLCPGFFHTLVSHTSSKRCWSGICEASSSSGGRGNWGSLGSIFLCRSLLRTEVRSSW